MTEPIRESATCGTCGHTLHVGPDREHLRCKAPWCMCSRWVRNSCAGAVGAAKRGECGGRAFEGGHDAGCPDLERAQ